MRKDSARVLIVGGGAVGVATAHHLVDEAIAARATRGLEIVLVERRDEIGPGLAYELDVDTHLLNTRAAGISAVFGNKPHFYEWLLENGSLWRPHFPAVRVTPTAFLPRGLFGLYLRDMVAQTERRAYAAGIDFTTVAGDIADIFRSGAGYTARTAAGTQLEADVVALCCGNAQIDAFPQFSGRAGYYPSPYPTGELVRRVAERDDVLVIGSRLSAIDAAVALLESERYRGTIKLVSRGGMLPTVRGEQSAHVFKVITRESVRRMAAERGPLRFADVAELCAAEAAAGGFPLDWHEVIRPGLDAQAYVLEEIFASAGRARPWQGMIYGLNEVIDEIYDVLHESERARLHTTLRSEFLTYRVSIPIENACKIARAMAQGRVTVHGGLDRLAHDDETGRFEATLRTPGANPVLLTGAVLVNATGFDNGSALDQSPLLRRMHAGGLLREHRYGGIDVEFDTGRAIAGDGTAQADVFAIGSVTSGVHYFTSALDVNVRHAARSARDIIKTVAGRRRTGRAVVRYADLPAIGVEA